METLSPASCARSNAFFIFNFWCDLLTGHLGVQPVVNGPFALLIGNDAQSTTRFLLSVPCQELEHSQPSDSVQAMEQKLQIDGLVFMFLSDDSVHYKTPRTRQLDDELGDCLCDIIDRETEIMCSLQHEVLQVKDALADLMKLSVKLDCFQALAQLAVENDYVKPTITTDRVLQIENGRHPVLEQCINPFVVNSAAFREAGTRAMLVTGANASGKSVYLRQCALITFMAHLGSFVPASKATIGLVDQIFTRLISIDSISTGLSSFATDLSAITDAVRHSSEDSLIIIDEFGKGTATLDGIALLVAMLQEFLDRGADCPTLLVSTHFHAIAKRSLVPKTDIMAYKMMRTVNDGQGNMVHLFQLDAGAATTSNASATALAAGLPAPLLSRADEVIEAHSKGEQVRPLLTEKDHQAARVNTEICERFLEFDFKAADDDGITDFLTKVVSLGKTRPKQTKS